MRSTARFVLPAALLATLLILSVMVMPARATVYGPIPVGTWPFDEIFLGWHVKGTITVSSVQFGGLLLDVSFTGTNPGGSAPVGLLELKSYLTMTTSLGTMTSLTFKLYYTDADLAAAGIDEATLQMYKWDGVTWAVLSTTLGSDSDGKYMQATVTTLSTFEGMGTCCWRGAPVGGLVEPVNKLGVFAPYLALFGVMAAVAIVAVKPWKREA